MTNATRSSAPPFVDHLRSHGWATVTSLGVTASELAETQALLDGLFDRFAELPEEKAVDLGVGGTRTSPIVPEINDCSLFEPRLRRTAVWKAAHRVAREVLGRRAFALYDHAIYKPPAPAGVTSWHQDAGFDDSHDHGMAIWIPFQDTDVVNGAMRYVTGSHQHGRMKHLVRTGPSGKQVFYVEAEEDSATDVPCPAGGATMHDFYTVHGAGANKGHETRRAWVIDFSTVSPVRLAGRQVKDTIKMIRG